jgi:hypothetical protein
MPHASAAAATIPTPTSALASQAKPSLAGQTRADRVKAEWCWAMLADHAWTGTDLKNKRHNADLRRNWADRLAETSQRLSSQAWKELKPGEVYQTVPVALLYVNLTIILSYTPGAVKDNKAFVTFRFFC